MAKTFYVSPGRSYTVTASEGTTITYPGITTPAATVGASGSITFNCTGTEITVSDDSAQIAQNFNNAGAAVAGAGEGSGGGSGEGSLEGVALLEGGNSFSGDQSVTGDVVINGSVIVAGGLECSADNLKEAQVYIPGSISEALISGHVYDLGVLTQNQDLSGLTFDPLIGYVQTCEIWMETGDIGYSITWPADSIWPDEASGIAMETLAVNTTYRFVVRKEPSGKIIINCAYYYSA